MKIELDLPENPTPHQIMAAVAAADPVEHRRWEVIGDTLVTQPSPINAHGVLQNRLGGRIDASYSQGYADPDEGWIIVSVPDLKDITGSDGVRRPKIPDLGGWRAARYRVNDAGYCPIAPDWVCEVLSPATAERDRGPKARDYAILGIGWYWLVDLDRAELEVRRLDGEGYAVHARHDLRTGFAADPFQQARFESNDFAFVLDGA